MKFILYHWNTISMNDIKITLEEAGHEVDCIYYVFADFDKDEEFEERMDQLFQKKRYDAVFSFDFFQVISKVCNRNGVIYISWVWDSPQVNLYSKECANSCNYIFVFDKEAYYDLTKQGIKTVYYLPLAANEKRLREIRLSDSEQVRYGSDVSFVGGLYDKQSLFDMITTLPEELFKKLYSIVEKQSYINGIDIIEQELTEDIWNEFMKYVSLDMGPDYLTSSRVTLFNRVFATKVTNIERTRIVSKLAKQYDFKLYTGSDTTRMPEVNNQGYVEYFHNMPKVFKASRININMTLRTIKTGIPLRILDIMGAGGFLITNYQEDLDLFFENGVDLVYYHTEDELFELLKYYNEHEEEREKIAKSGYEKVKKYHNYQVRIDYILDTVFYHKGQFDYMGLPVRKGSNSYSEVITSTEEINKLNISIWNKITEENVVDAYDQFVLFYRSHTELTDEQKKEKLVYECVLKICIKELQNNGRCSFISNYDYDLENILSIVKLIINLCNTIQASEDYNNNLIMIHSMIQNEELTCLQLIEIILTTSEKAILVMNLIAEYMMNIANYDKVIPFLIEAEELDPNDKHTIINLVKILEILGENEMAEEYREKL